MADDRPDHPSDGASLDKLIRILWIGAGVAFLSLIAAHMTDLLAAVGIGTLIFLASFASGAFLGFLFGVPRVLSNDDGRGGAHKRLRPAGGRSDLPDLSGTRRSGGLQDRSRR